MIRTVVASVLLVVTFSLAVFNVYLYVEHFRDYNRRFELYTLRENVLRLEYFQAVDDKIGLSSTLSLIEDQSKKLGDVNILLLVDSLKATSKGGDFARYSQALLSYTGDQLSKPLQRIPLLSLLGSFLLGVFAILLLVMDVYAFHKSIRKIDESVQNLRLGILIKHISLGVDFRPLENSLLELSRDIERAQRNARKLVQA